MSEHWSSVRSRWLVQMAMLTELLVRNGGSEGRWPDLHVTAQEVNAGDRRVDPLQLLVFSCTVARGSPAAAGFRRVPLLQTPEVPV